MGQMAWSSSGPLFNGSSLRGAVVASIEAVVGSDQSISGPIDAETSFQADLEISSIQFVLLAERIIEIFGEVADLFGWITGLNIEEILVLTVGDLTDFLEVSVSHSRILRP